MRALAIAAAAGLAVTAAAGPTTPTTLAYVENATSTNPSFQRWEYSAWNSAAAVGSMTSTVYWQTIRNSPTTDQLALLTLSDDQGVRLRFFDGSTWGATTTLTSLAGSSVKLVFDAEYEGDSGELLTVYRKAGSTSLYYRTFTSSAPAEQTYTPGLAAAPEEIRLVRRPGTDEIIMLVAAGPNLYAAVWNGSSFGNFTTLSTTLSDMGRAYGLGVGIANGVGVAVWANAAATAPSYKTWNGTAWSATGAMASVGTGTPCAFQVVANPRTTSSELLVTIQDTARHLSVCNWTGSAWGTMTTADSNLANPYEGRVHLAYQPDGSKALLVYHTSGQTALRYRTWSGTSWSGALTGPDLTTDAQYLRLATGISGTEIVGVVQRKATPNTLTDYLAYSATGTVTVGTVEGLSASAVPGVTLPPPPSDVEGVLDLNYGNNSTTTLAPGAYRDLSTGNDAVLNLSSGRYVFRRWTSNSNGNIFNCNTSAGDIDIIFTNGDVILNNNFTMTNSGPGKATIHVVNGNFDAKNNGGLVSASVVAYNGYIDFNMNTEIQGALYAKGNVNVTSGYVEGGPLPFAPPPAKLTAFRWSNGAFSATTQLSTSVIGYAQRKPFDISQPPLGAPSFYVSRWREVGPDE